MTRTDKVAVIILGAAAGLAIARYFKMPAEERKEFCDHLKNRTFELLDNAEETVEKIEQGMSDFKEKRDNEWIDKLYAVKKTIKSLYGSDKHFLL
ncbi:MAG: hypothetical protein JSS98_14695 [Bacteroidetes bacterium]|nr:hypothetical protein [Bacteroidota bacterium]